MIKKYFEKLLDKILAYIGINKIHLAINDLKNQMFLESSKNNQKFFEYINTLALRIDELDRKMQVTQDSAFSLHEDLVRFHEAWQYKILGENPEMFRMKEIYQLFPLYRVDDIPLKRIGRIGDGGYVMLDDFVNNNIAYSFGINDDTSWDSDIVDNGINYVYMYDHTIEQLPETRKNFIWFKIGISGEINSDTPELKTLEQLLHENEHDNLNNMLLKMDVEGAEWDVFCNTTSNVLSKFSQIVVELHNITSLENHTKIVKALENINKTHVPINVHGNNWCGYEIGNMCSIPHTIEVTYINKYTYEKMLCRCEKFFPSNIDVRNTEKYSEIIMGLWGKI